MEICGSPGAWGGDKICWLRFGGASRAETVAYVTAVPYRRDGETGHMHTALGKTFRLNTINKNIYRYIYTYLKLLGMFLRGPLRSENLE